MRDEEWWPMDDGPRTGGLQALFVLLGGALLLVAVANDSWVAYAMTGVTFAGFVALEAYARRRVREDREREERRIRSTVISDLDFDDPFGRG